MNYEPRDYEIVDHYNRFIANLQQVITLNDIPEPAPNPIYIIEFAPPTEDYDWVYTTVGVSRQLMPSPKNASLSHAEHRVEFIIYTRQQQPSLVDFLAKLAIYPFQLNTFFAVGHTISGNVGVVTSSPLTDVLLTRPTFQPPEFEFIHHHDGSHTQILWIIPIHTSERLFVKQNGYKALEHLFSEHEADTSDLWRPPVI